MIQVYSIFSSIQGESSLAGRPCGFVRVTGCPLNCSYCDTRAACESPGRTMKIEEVLQEVSALNMRLVEVTGGEPLAQDESVHLLKALCNAGYDVMLETSGAFSIELIDPRVRVVMDVKCPDSGMADRMFQQNLEFLVPSRHEVKFVVSSKDDFNWAVELCRKKKLSRKAELLVSPVLGVVEPRDLAKWMLSTHVPFRLQLQLHKVIWSGEEGER